MPLLTSAGSERKSDLVCDTPQVYSYFLGVYKVSVAVGLAGYALLILEVCGMGPFLRQVMDRAAPFMLLWYGLYFGVLGRDCAEVAADRMVRPYPADVDALGVQAA